MTSERIRGEWRRDKRTEEERLVDTLMEFLVQYHTEKTLADRPTLCVCRYQKVQKSVCPMELEFQVVMIHSIWLLGIELKSSGRVAIL